ncbi:1-phosphatidylinositol-4,5-bisphosphate phosphodiesterase epsilon-1 [Papilio xuthus]|uniref:Phosphoinositide phospholipase C n=1 Tax=Papilio xuthus TaxID=66420 RepID=A0A0N1I682_PAPXU|nr:1-phosphatidylinositol-4,5-bisphosphate phosphodiesterase epsilon-1 [Papilio xuthus]
MDHISSIHQHRYALSRTTQPVFGDYLRTAINICEEPVFAPSQKTSGGEFENEALYELEGGGYCPVQPLPHDHGVTMFPLAPQNGERMDRHVLQIMHHGTACVVGEAEWNGTFAHLRLERACALLTWCRTAHRPQSQHVLAFFKNTFDFVPFQAIKFRGLNPLSPRSSVKHAGGAGSAGRHVTDTSAPASSFESSESSDSTATQVAQSQSATPRARCLNAPAVHHPCYRCSSINEAMGRKICRKHPLALIAHTETQLVRTYPAGLRIDSSNFDPVTFWSCGVQLVALNYQTEDAAMAVNAAMFEGHGCAGYVRKPHVMWDPGHIAYRRFNPMDKEFDGIHAAHLTLAVISGQYVAENVYSFYNAFVEVEILGVPADCKKIRTKVARRNALNPVWNETFNFKINFPELAFVRFEIYDADTNYMLSQRVIPLHCLRPGYRHVRLRSPTNQPLNMASLLIFSRCSEESAGESWRGDAEPGSPRQRRRIHFLVVYAVARHEPYSILKVTQDTTANEAIAQCLSKGGVCRSARGSYVLVEEVASRAPTQRVLGPHERVLRAATARPAARLLLKRVGDDPSSRAWLTSIRRSASTDRPQERSVPSDEESSAHEEEPRRPDSFLVCVHNVSHEIPYAILKVPLSATASYVVYQALTKARCHDDPKRFVLVEELEWGGRAGAGPQQRPLADDEVVYAAQVNFERPTFIFTTVKEINSIPII